MISRKEFTDQVEKLLLRKGTDVMGAIVRVCENNKLEPESAKRLISQPLKEKLEAEATGLNMVNRGNHSQSSLKGFFAVTEK